MQDIAAAIRQGLRVYSILLGALIILTETEWDRFLSLFRALDGWIIRGFLQLFEAGLTLELARSLGASDFHRSTQVKSASGSIPAAGGCTQSCWDQVQAFCLGAYEFPGTVWPAFMTWHLLVTYQPNEATQVSRSNLARAEKAKT